MFGVCYTLITRLLLDHLFQGDRMPFVASLIRTYTSQDAYEQDAARLARLGYIVASVVEEPARWILTQRLCALFGPMPTRFTVTYSDYGASPL
jgi:hypothetical protein